MDDKEFFNRQNEIIAQGYRRFRRGLITATEMVTEIDKKLDAFRKENGQEARRLKDDCFRRE